MGGAYIKRRQMTIDDLTLSRTGSRRRECYGKWHASCNTVGVCRVRHCYRRPWARIIACRRGGAARALSTSNQTCRRAVP